ncbi:MAG TPA: GGDEF domain-containing protein [Geminicoccaceae bacterium]|nr:GGDEF domain-containing protein [Geminicoccaceae bacterium]
MINTDSIEQARRLAETALAVMARFGIAPTPNNYMIWYSHCSGCYPELSRRIAALEARGDGFSDEILAELHEQFFGTGRQVRLLNETCERIETTMAHLLSLVAGMTRDAGGYGDQLARFGDALEGHAQVDDLKDLIDQMLSATRRMQQRAEQLEAQLGQSARQIEFLRTDLASAQREANTDSLTGIANRKYFDHELYAAAEEAMATGQPLCLLLADIDHFKQFNDTFGHQIGDQVLRLVAQVLTRSIKGRDLAARYGGEEFAIILPQTDLDGAYTLAEQIRATVAGNRIRSKPDGADLGRITMSIGCARYIPEEPLTDLIQRADDALYRAKRAGRNRVLVAEAALDPADLASAAEPA